MDCIVYIDLFFLLNFWMNSLVLFTIRRLTRTYRTFLCLSAAFLGAAGSVGILILYFLTSKQVTFVLHIPLIILMNLLAFGMLNLLWHLLLFFLNGALLGGAMLSITTMFDWNASAGSIVLISLAALSVGIALERQCKIRWREERMKAKTVLEFEDKKMFATALIDTGNRLYDPFYHKPVILVDERILHDIVIHCREHYPEKLQFIPYQSVGRSKGMLEGVMFDSVSIQWQEKKLQFPKVIAASTKESLYKGKEYQVIFHCGLLEEI